MGAWRKAVLAAAQRLARQTDDRTFLRRDLLAFELPRIISQVGSKGATPEQTLSRELQELARDNLLEFVDRRGTYRLLVDDEMIEAELERLPIARYEIDGFRSLRDFKIELTPGLNALVGPNGSGKTNFIDFLDFLSTLVRGDASAAISLTGGVGRTFSQENGKRASPSIIASVCAIAEMPRISPDEADSRRLFRFEYSVEIKFSRSASAVFVAEERIRFFALHNDQERHLSWRHVGAIHIKRRTPNPEVEPSIEISPRLLTTAVRNPLRYVRRTNLTNNRRILQQDGDVSFLQPPNPDESILTSRPLRPALSAIRVAVSRGRAFNLNPAHARTPDEISKPPFIEPDGSGLSACLYHMFRARSQASTRYAYTFEKYGSDTLDVAVEWTKLVLPELRDIQAESDPHSGRYLIFLVIGDGSEKGLRIPLEAASEGTIKWLCFVCILLTREGAYSVEEPENYLHPRMQQFMVDLIRSETMSEANREYFVISTHSETIINQCSPEELLVFRFTEGRTDALRLEKPKEIASRLNETGFGLGHFYARNVIA